MFLDHASLIPQYTDFLKKLIIVFKWNFTTLPVLK